MVISANKSGPSIHLAHDFPIVEDIKILGIVIDRHLNFHKHVDITCRKASSRFTILRQLRGVCSEPILRNSFKTSILSLFTCCAPVFLGLQKTQADRVQRILTRGERIISCSTTHVIDYQERKKDLSIRFYKTISPIQTRHSEPAVQLYPRCPRHARTPSAAFLSSHSAVRPVLPLNN